VLFGARGFVGSDSLRRACRVNVIMRGCTALPQQWTVWMSQLVLLRSVLSESDENLE